MFDDTAYPPVSEDGFPQTPIPGPMDGSVRQILLVDDEDGIRRALTRYLTLRGYDVKSAHDGPTALHLLERHKFVLMVCDLRMPGMSGQQVVLNALGIDPDLAIIMLTGTNDASTATSVLAMGATDYLVKPIALEHLSSAIDGALQKRHLRVEQRKIERLIRDTVVLRTVQLEKEKLAQRDLTVNIVDTLINAMEAKDVYLRGHSARVADLAASIANEIGLDEDTVEQIRLAGRLHDVGKIGIREAILNKPDSLSEEEFDHVKEHVRIGMEILGPLQHLGRVLEFVRHHHERLDGRGYPRGIHGEEISIGGMILAVSDAFDALTSKRAYRESMSVTEALEIIQKNVGSHYTQAIVTALARLKSGRRSLVFLPEIVDELGAPMSESAA